MADEQAPLVEEARRKLYRPSGGPAPNERPGVRPEAALHLTSEYAQLVRDFEVHAAVDTVLTTGYEEANLAVQRSREIPTISLSDRAAPVHKHVRPNLLLNLVVSVSVDLFVARVLLFPLDYVC